MGVKKNVRRKRKNPFPGGEPGKGGAMQPQEVRMDVSADQIA